MGHDIDQGCEIMQSECNEMRKMYKAVWVLTLEVSGYAEPSEGTISKTPDCLPGKGLATVQSNGCVRLTAIVKLK